MIWRLDGKRCLFVIICAVLFTACLGISVCAQSAGQGWEKAAGGKQQFEVASVRENKAGGDSNSNFTLDGNGNAYWVMDKDVKTAPEGSLFRATNQTLMRYIIFAYKLNGTEELALRVHQCPECTAWAGLGLDLPAWVANTRYDIEARASARATKDQMRLAIVAESLPAQTGLATFPKPVIDRTGLGGTFDLRWSGRRR